MEQSSASELIQLAARGGYLVKVKISPFSGSDPDAP
jgi:hypothetical protein